MARSLVTVTGPIAPEQAGITDGLVRLSVGIEDVDEIIEDLAQGLDKISG